MAEPGPTLTIVIPALDEEQAIGSTIDRCLEARAAIVEGSSVGAVEIVVVSDGSTDDTEAIARSRSEVDVLAFDRNRGYGSAIKSGFEHARGDWLGFIDADGTCDPLRFADLCRALDEQQADLVLGSRMGPGSRMPWIRSVGNAAFAWLLGLLSQKRIADTASGMRVLRRSALPHLLPLPDGLHFTPAMSARALLEGVLRVVEVPMPYAERVGRSKLSVVRDGWRFFSSIFQAAICYRPARPLLLLASAVAALGFVVGIGPTVFYLQNGRLEEWMIYRILLSSFLATGTALLACGAIVADRIAELAYPRSEAGSGRGPGIARWLEGLFGRRSRWWVGSTLVAVAVAVAWPGIVQFVTTGAVDLHWSRAVFAALLLVLAMVLAITTFLLNMTDLIEQRRRDAGEAQPPDRIHRSAG